MQSAHNTNAVLSGEDAGNGPAISDKGFATDMSDLVETLEQSSLDGPKPFHFVNTCSAIADLVDSLVDLPANPPSLYFDLEGVNLSRQGTISILQLLVFPQKRIYLIDIHTLGSKAFSTA